jgi:hypothetical protein
MHAEPHLKIGQCEMPAQAEPRPIAKGHEMVVPLNCLCSWGKVLHPALGIEFADIRTPEIFGHVDESDRNMKGLSFRNYDLGYEVSRGCWNGFR